jgi:ABC-2 type transport system ATP-binding protein
MENTVIQVQDLCKVYSSVVAVDRLTFQVQRGEIFGLLGPNGAGKTTTIRMLMDITRPDGGSVRIFGQSPAAVRERIGYLPEERGLYRGLRVIDCLTYLGELKGMSHGRARTRALELLARVELSEWARHKVQELSRGMQQKVQLVASIVHDPDLVVLDEPFQGLDPVNVETVKTVIRELCGAGKTIVLSAHEMNQVEALCERIALIHHGRAVLYGTLSEIKKKFSPNAIEISPPLTVEDWGGVASTELFDGKQRVYLAPGMTAHLFLRAILDHGLSVDRFETATMPLEQIFIQVVKG